MLKRIRLQIHLRSLSTRGAEFGRKLEGQLDAVRGIFDATVDATRGMARMRRHVTDEEACFESSMLLRLLVVPSLPTVKFSSLAWTFKLLRPT